MWGQCRGQAVTSPMETKFTKVDSIFACFASPPSMFRPLIVGEWSHVCIFASLERILYSCDTTITNKGGSFQINCRAASVGELYTNIWFY